MATPDDFRPDEVEPLSASEQFGILERGVLPPDDEALAGDAISADDPAAVSDAPPPPIGRSWDFDFGLRQFRVIKGRGPVEIRGVPVLEVWAEKCLNTRRGAHPIYSDTYGIDEPWHLIGKPGHSLDTSLMQSQIVQALTFHPRITNVRDFDFDFDEANEALFVSFVVVLDDEDEVVLEGLQVF